METIGSRIKSLRKEKMLTQQQLADYIGVSKTSVIYWEKDETIPKHESLLLLSQKLGVDSNYIMYGEGNFQLQTQSKQFQAQSENSLSTSNLSPEVEKLINLLKKLDSEDRLNKEIIQHLNTSLELFLKVGNEF